jgi:glycosyltransferase involved in cell wall biosynthesis
MQSVPEKRNILFVSTTREVYGGELSLLPVVRNIGPRWNPHFLVDGPGPLDSLLRGEGLPVYRLGVNVSDRRREKPIRALRTAQLAYLLRQRKIDLVHLNLHYRSALISAACARVGIPMVVHVRNMIDQPVADSLRNSSGIICISHAVRKSLTSIGKLAEEQFGERLWVIPDGRDLSSFRSANRNRVRCEWGIQPEVPLIGMAARITSMKGQDTFLRMAAGIKQAIHGARFVLIGSTFDKRDEPYFRSLHELTSNLGLGKDVIFAGYRRDMADALAALDCFAHPSRRGAFVSVLIEAMASGLPILASDVDGIPECVGRDGAAVLLSPDDPAAWARAAACILSDPQRARSLGEKAKERAYRLFDIHPLARQTVEVFQTVAARTPSTGSAAARACI